MPHPTTSLRVVPLNGCARGSSQLGAEVLLPEYMKTFDPQSLSESEKETLRQAFFEQGVLVIRDQLALNPDVLYDVAELLDPQPKRFHSGGKKQVSDPRNILSQNNCSRIPRAPQVTLIGKGHFEGYEGIPELDLKHLVCKSRLHPISYSHCVLGSIVISRATPVQR